MISTQEDNINAHILLVDDSGDNIFMMSKILDCFGCTYLTAVNGQEALKLAMENEFDFILMDLHMPVMDGLSATRYIRVWETENKKKRNFIIGITGSAPGSGESCFREAGMDDYIIKPFRMDELKSKLKSKLFAKKYA